MIEGDAERLERNARQLPQIHRVLAQDAGIDALVEINPALQPVAPARELGAAFESRIGSLTEKIALLEENRALLLRDRSQTQADRHVAIVLGLFEKTALSDREIADILEPSLGRNMPEWVAYERRLHARSGRQ